MKKRLLAVLLAAAMCLSLLPASALAVSIVDDEQSATPEIPAGEEVSVQSGDAPVPATTGEERTSSPDASGDGDAQASLLDTTTISTSPHITADTEWAGVTIDGTGNDFTADSPLTVTIDSTATVTISAQVKVSGYVKFDGGGTLKNATTSGTTGVINVAANSNVTFENVTVDGNNSDPSNMIFLATSSSGTTVTLKGATLQNTQHSGLWMQDGNGANCEYIFDGVTLDNTAVTVGYAGTATAKGTITTKNKVTIQGKTSSTTNDGATPAITRDSDFTDGDLFQVGTSDTESALTLKDITVQGDGETAMGRVINVVTGSVALTGATIQKFVYNGDKPSGAANNGYFIALDTQGDTRSLTMDADSVIQNNTIQSGSLFAVGGGHTAELKGTITGNTLTEEKGQLIKVGVVSGTKLTLDGAQITGNTLASGSYAVRACVGSGGTNFLRVKGATQITGNTYTDTTTNTTTQQNVCVESGATMALDGELTDGAAIGVTTQTTPTSATPVPVAVSGTDYTVTEADAAYFSSDAVGYAARFDGANSKVVLGTQGDYYVSANGNDTTGNGTADAPFATIQAALEKIDTAGVIHVMDDLTLTSTVTVSKNVTILSDDGNDATENDSFSIIRGSAIGNSSMFSVSDGGALTLKDLTVDGNGGSTGYITVYGGGVNVASGAALTATNCTFQYHKLGTSQHGAAVSSAGTATFTSCTFQYNTVQTNGSALHSKAGTMTVDQCTITENTCESSQGAIDVEGGTVTVTNTRITKNKANYAGPALYITGGTVNLGDGVVITENTLTSANRSDGSGAIQVGGSSTSSATLNLSGSVQITGNTYGENSSKSGTLANLYIINNEYTTVALTGALAEDAAIGVTTAEKPTGTATVTVAVGGTDSEGDAYTVTESDAAKFIPDSDAYAAVYDATDSDNPKVILGTLGDYYVSEDDGDDNNAGTADAPFATIQQAYDTLGAFGTIHVMSDLALSAGLTFNGSKKITVISDTNGDLTDSEEVHTVTRGTSLTGSAMLKVSAGDVTLRNITFDGNKENVESMYALRVEGSESARATLTLGAGAVVQNNKAGASDNGENNDGAGVSIGAYGTLNIQDGARIQNNETKGRGGGVSPRAATSVVNMTGGEITGNKRNADSYHGGGGVNIAGGQFIMSGGSITGNSDPFSSGKGGGVYFAGGALTVSGTAYIGGNTAGTDGSYASNVYLNSNQTVTIGADHLTAGANIGVYTATDPSDSADVQFATGANADDRAYFHSDKQDDAGVIYCSGSADTPVNGVHASSGHTAANTLWLSVAARGAASVDDTVFSGEATSPNAENHKYATVDEALTEALKYAAADTNANNITVIMYPTSDVTGTLAAGDTLTVSGTVYSATGDADSSSVIIHSDGSVKLTSGSVVLNAVDGNLKNIVIDGQEWSTTSGNTVTAVVPADETSSPYLKTTSGGAGVATQWVDLCDENGAWTGMAVITNADGIAYLTDPIANGNSVGIRGGYAYDGVTVGLVTVSTNGSNEGNVIIDAGYGESGEIASAWVTVNSAEDSFFVGDVEYKATSAGQKFYIAADGTVYTMTGEAAILLNEGALGSVTALSGGMTSYQIPNALVLGSAAPRTFEVSVDRGYFKVGSAAVGTGVTFASALTASGKVVTGQTGTLDTATAYTYVSFTVDDTASLDDLQSWLRGVTFYKNTADEQTVSARGENVELTNGGNTVEAFRGHYYEFVPASSGIKWSDAYAAAKGKTFNGLKGYLITVTSQQEHDYIYQKFGQNGWMGATRAIGAYGADGATYDYSKDSYSWDWYWVCGPEANTKIGTQKSSGGGMSSVASYANWKSGEPNGKNVPGAGYEGFGQYGYGSNGLWNDLPDKAGSGNIKGYYVEYGGYKTDQATTAAAADTRTVTPENTQGMTVSAQADKTADTITLTVSPVDTDQYDYVVVDGDGQVVALDESAMSTATAEDGTTTLTITGLTDGGTYQVVAVAKDAEVTDGSALNEADVVQASAPVTLASGADADIVAAATQEDNEDGTVTITLADAKDPTKDYALIDQTTGEVIGWFQGDATNGVTFDDLDPSHAYAVVEAANEAGGTPLLAEEVSSTAVIYPDPLFDELSAEYQDGTVTVTVEDPVAGAEYWAVDANNKIGPVTVNVDGTVTISGLATSTAYTIVAVAAGTEEADVPTTGTAITTPAAPVSADDISRKTETDETTGEAKETDQVTVSNTDASIQYALVDQNGNYIDQNGQLSETPVWVEGNGGELTWSGLDPDSSYSVLTLPVGADDDTVLPAESDAVDPLLSSDALQTGYDAEKGVTVTVNPADADKVYALLDSESNVVKEWTKPTVTENEDGTLGLPTVVFDGLDVGAEYTVVCVDAARAESVDESAAKDTGAAITTVSSAAIPADGGAAGVEGVTVTAPAEGKSNTGAVTVTAATTDEAGEKTGDAAITVAEAGDSFTVSGNEDGKDFSVDFTAGTDGQVFTVDENGDVTTELGGGEGVTVNDTLYTAGDEGATLTVDTETGTITVTLEPGAEISIGAEPDGETYTAGDEGATLTVDETGGVTLTEGSVAMTGDGQSVTVGETEIVKTGDTGTVTVTSDGVVTLTDGATATINGVTYTGPGIYDLTAEDGVAEVQPLALLGATATTLTLTGEPGAEYTCNDVTVTADENGKLTFKNLTKNTAYTVTSRYGDLTVSTSAVNAQEIAQAFDSAAADGDGSDTVTEGESAKVTVTVDGNGNYVVTLLDDITAADTGAAAGEATVTVGDDWGDVTLDLNGHTISGADATESAGATAAIEFVSSTPAGNGTDLTVTSSAPNGKVVGGSGAAGGYADGADGIVSSAADTALVLSGENVTVLGGDGANADAEGGDGGSGVSGSLSVVIVDGSTVIGGSGGSATTSDGVGGDGGDGVNTQGGVTVINGTLTGGDAGTGGSAGLGLNGDGTVTGDNSAVTNGKGGDTATISVTSTSATISNGTPGAAYTLYDAEGTALETVYADETGKAVFTDLDSGTTYLVKVGEPGAQTVLATVTTAKLSSGANRSSSSSSSDGISGTGKVNGGSVSISPASPAAGETVTLTLTPDSGYVPVSLAVLNQNGDSLPLSANSDGTYSFTMPSGGVSINAVFRALENGYADCDRDENCPAYGFADLDLDLWYHDGVHFCVENGYMVGVGNDLFAPDGVLTRAELAVMLWRVSGSPAVIGETFSDVAENTWYTQAVTWGAAAGVVKGYGNGAFGPADPITREQLALMLYRCAGSPAVDAAADMAVYVDADAISDWAETAMRWAVGSGVIQGKGGACLDPQCQTTRDEAAAMLMRFLAGNR